LFEKGWCNNVGARDAMLVMIRDWDELLLLLQQDRLRHETIMAELAKIDHAMTLSSTSCLLLLVLEFQCFGF
jgi:hypothetical protein